MKGEAAPERRDAKRRDPLPGLPRRRHRLGGGGLEALDLFGDAGLPELSHGVCEACRERVLAAV